MASLSTFELGVPKSFITTFLYLHYLLVSASQSLSGSDLNPPSGRNKAKVKEAKERKEESSFKRLIAAMEAVSEAITKHTKDFDHQVSRNEKLEHAKFLMQMFDRHKSLGDVTKAKEFLDQAETAFGMAIDQSAPTRMDEAEDAIVDNLLKHNSTGQLKETVEEENEDDEDSDEDEDNEGDDDSSLKAHGVT